MAAVWVRPAWFRPSILPRHRRILVEVETRRGATGKLKPRRHLAAADHRFQRFGDGVLRDAVDAAVAADEANVERAKRVLHPEARDLGLGAGKEHAAILRQMGPERPEEQKTELRYLQ